MNDEEFKSHEVKRKKGHEDAEEIREIFSALNESIPSLISGLIGSVYNPEAAGNMATAIGRFYSKLIEEGIPEEVALDMTKKYVGALDFQKIMNIASDGASPKKIKDLEIDIEE